MTNHGAGGRVSDGLGGGGGGSTESKHADCNAAWRLAGSWELLVPVCRRRERERESDGRRGRRRAGRGGRAKCRGLPVRSATLRGVSHGQFDRGPRHLVAPDRQIPHGRGDRPTTHACSSEEEKEGRKRKKQNAAPRCPSSCSTQSASQGPAPACALQKETAANRRRGESRADSLVDGSMDVRIQSAHRRSRKRTRKAKRPHAQDGDRSTGGLDAGRAQVVHAPSTASAACEQRIA